MSDDAFHYGVMYRNFQTSVWNVFLDFLHCCVVGKDIQDINKYRFAWHEIQPLYLD